MKSLFPLTGVNPVLTNDQEWKSRGAKPDRSWQKLSNKLGPMTELKQSMGVLG